MPNKYIILQSQSAEELATLVNQKIDEGYQPQGGVATAMSMYPDPENNEVAPMGQGTCGVLSQAMILSDV